MQRSIATPKIMLSTQTSTSPIIAARVIDDDLQLRLIAQVDAHALRKFEIAHRTWFERFIATRGNYFYLPEGIQAHIAHCLSEYAAGRMQPMLIVDPTGEILGRINLHQINPDDASIGYRLAEHATGRGLAYKAARLLVQDAQLRWHLPQLRSLVAPDNHASARILQKLGFSLQGQAQKATHLVHGDVFCDAYLLRFTN